jgi:peptidoglycan/LPS O-acetylase OafA/YrhL
MHESRSAIPALDGVRGFACLLVFFNHLINQNILSGLQSFGQLGVMLFFCLSGFLMAYHYMPGERNVRYWLAFLTRRMFRIYPLFAITTLMAYLLNLHFNNRLLPLFTYDQFIEQLMLQEGVRWFWTIIVEIKFYMVFAVSAYALTYLTRNTPRTLAILSLCWIMLASLDIDRARLQLDLLPYLVYFLGGVIAAELYRLGLNRLKYLWNSVAALCCLIIIFCIPQVSWVLFGTYHKWFIYEPFMAILMSLTVLSAALSSGIMHYIFANPAIRFIGKISFSLYLTHNFVIIISKTYIDYPYVPQIVEVTLLSISFAWLLWMCVEKPFNQLGRVLANRLHRL